MELGLVADLPLILPHVLGRLAGAPPCFAHTSFDEDDEMMMVFASPKAALQMGMRQLLSSRPVGQPCEASDGPVRPSVLPFGAPAVSVLY